MPQPTVIREAASAKVNLSLRVLGRRPDGYHELESVVAFAQSAADAVEFVPGAACEVTASGRFADGLRSENIAEVALRQLAEIAPGMCLGTVRLAKNLPLAAGIGGGSADAAAVLRAVRAANGDAARYVDWMNLAATLGADVPVCLVNRASLVCGIGDDVRPLRALPSMAIVLVNSLTEMPPDKTAQVFGRLAAPCFDGGRLRPDPPDFATSDELITHMASTGNDLSAPALSVAPEIKDVMRVLEVSRGCRYAALSGAGPTCFGVYDDMLAARSAADAISARRPDWWVLASELG